MTNVAVLAGSAVSVPLSSYRGEEFSRRMYFFARRFQQVHIISFDPKPTKNYVPIIDKKASNITVHRIKRKNILSPPACLDNLLSKIEADVVFCDTLGDAYLGFSIKLRRKIPLVTYVRGYDSDLTAIALKARLGLSPEPGLVGKLLSLRDRVVFHFSDKIFCVSPPLVRYVKEIIPKKKWDDVLYIPQSYEYTQSIPHVSLELAENLLAEVREQLKNKNIKPIVFVGSLSYTKRPDIALRAFKYILEEIPESFMFIFGDGPMRSLLTVLAKKLKVSEYVAFLGRWPRYHVLALLSKGEALIFPSLSEGFSNAVSEAMAVGCPVIGYASKFLKYVRSHDACIAIKSTSPVDYAKIVVKLIRDERLREMLVQKAKDYIRPLVLFPEKKRFELICDNARAAILASNV